MSSMTRQRRCPQRGYFFSTDRPATRGVLGRQRHLDPRQVRRQCASAGTSLGGIVAAQFVKAAGGDMIETAPDWLVSADRAPARQTATRGVEVWNSWLVLVVFLLLVSADCYLRKRQGLV